MDSMRAHLTEDVKKKVNEENTIPVIIPVGLTKILQPLDISVNKSFKTNFGILNDYRRTLFHKNWKAVTGNIDKCCYTERCYTNMYN